MLQQGMQQHHLNRRYSGSGKAVSGDIRNYSGGTHAIVRFAACCTGVGVQGGAPFSRLGILAGNALGAMTVFQGLQRAVGIA